MDLLLKALPLGVLAAGLIWGAIELRVRNILDKRDEKLKEELRRELQTPIGNIGKDALDALHATGKLSNRVLELETKVGVFWDMIRKSTANLLRRVEDKR